MSQQRPKLPMYQKPQGEPNRPKQITCYKCETSFESPDPRYIRRCPECTKGVRDRRRTTGASLA
jgi:hypothetical protein